VRGWGVERPKAARASKRAKRVSEPTVGMLFVMIVAGGGGIDWNATGWLSERSEPRANKRAKRVSEPPCLE
jgi:hypothetical protein